MAFYERMRSAMDRKDTSAYADLVAEDFEFVRHKDGSTLNRSEAMDMVNRMMASGHWTTEDARCIYENDDICVSHSKMSFPDGTREAVMSVYRLRDGKAVRLETGATPLS